MQSDPTRHTVATLLTFILLVLSLGAPSLAQTGRITSSSRSQLKTDVSFVLLVADRVPAQAAQQWGRIFDRAGARIRIRQALGNDRPEVTETRRGSWRYVKATGLLEKSGSIIFGNRRFQQSQAAALAEWIRELKIYGAQGNDEGKPGYGLTKVQFDRVFKSLEAKVQRDPAGQELYAALRTIALPASLPLRMTPAATDWLKKTGSRRKAQEGLAGLSRGVVLAIVLNNEGLGFRPGRTPEGRLELRVSPLSDKSSPWPVGWPLQRSPINSIPKFVEIVPVELTDVPLADVIVAISAKTEVPILIDQHRVRKANIQLDKLLVNQDYRKVTWSSLLNRVTFPSLMRELLEDESGTPFVWITTRTVSQLNERAKQRDRLFEQKAK